MIQFLPTGDFKKVSDNHLDEYLDEQIVESLLQFPDDNEYGFFKGCDLEYPGKIKESTQDFLLCPYQVQAGSELLSDFMNSVEQHTYRPTKRVNMT